MGKKRATNQPLSPGAALVSIRWARTSLAARRAHSLKMSAALAAKRKIVAEEKREAVEDRLVEILIEMRKKGILPTEARKKIVRMLAASGVKVQVRSKRRRRASAKA
jgi:hypothetical protein